MLTNVTPFPSVKKMHEKVPLSEALQNKVLEDRNRFQSAVEEGKQILFMGPCSIHNLKTDLLLGEKVAELQHRFDQYLFIFRSHLEKPRSNHFWRGYLLDPMLDGSCDLEKGIVESRAFLIELIKKGLPISYEFIDPFLAPFVEDLITVGFIGARTVYSQTHRQLAATLLMPIVFKNGMEGRIEGAIDAMQMSRLGLTTPKMGLYGPEIVFAQNSRTHLMLRGGHDGPNFDLVTEALAQLTNRGIQGGVFIDCAHQNSRKNPGLQLTLLKKLLESSPQGASGFMIECHLNRGNQPFSSDPKGGLSITDPCLDIHEVAAALEITTALRP
ncbi:MAG: 3-deoxy-7-phosphoheptulonate synthase [Chlamydiia bacterium]